MRLSSPSQFFNAISLVFFCIFCIFCSSSYALNQNFDANIYKTSSVPSVQYCTDDINPLVKEAEYKKTDIDGPLPYIRYYNAATQDNLNRSREMVEGVFSSGGWTDNYHNYILVEKKSATSFVLQMRLAGEKDDTFYKASSSDGVKINSINRIYASRPLNFLVAGNDVKNGDYIARADANHMDKQVQFTSGSLSTLSTVNFRLNQYGVISNFKYIKGLKPNVYLFRMVNQSFPDGKALGFSYDGFGGLISVADNAGHRLDITREYPDADLTKSIIKKIVLVKNNINKPSFLDVSTLKSFFNEAQPKSAYAQEVTYQYNSYDWVDYLNNKPAKIYVIKSAKSTLDGAENYSYDLGSLSNFLATPPGGVGLASYYGDQYRVPLLTFVSHQKDFWVTDIIEWNYTIPNNWSAKLSSVHKKSDYSLDASQLIFSSGGTVSNETGSKYENFSSRKFVNLSGSEKYHAIRIDISGALSNPYTTYNFYDYPCAKLNNAYVGRMGLHNHYGRLDYVVDKKGVATSFSYDALGRIKTLTEAQGTPLQRVTTYEYTKLSDAAASTNIYNTPNKIIKPDMIIENVISIRGQIESQTITYPNQIGSQPKKTTYSYITDATSPKYGLLSQVDEPRGITTSYEYDINRNKTAVKRIVAGQQKSKIFKNFNDVGVPELIENADGTKEDFEFSISNHLKKHTITGVDGSQIVKVLYNDQRHGKPISIGYSDGSSFWVNYDTAGRKISEWSPEGNLEYVYHDNGNLAIKKWAYSNKMEYISETDATQYFEQDLYGYTVKEYLGDDAQKNHITYTYDANGQRETAKDAIGSMKRWTYDALNRMKTYTNESGHVETYDYDALDNKKLFTDGNSLKTNYTFVDGSLVATADGAEIDKSSTYDLSGNVEGAVFRNRKCGYTGYDSLNRYAAQSCFIVGNNQPNKSVNYGYTYDTKFFGEASKITGSRSTATQGVDTEYEYDGFGRITIKKQTNKSQSEYGYPAKTTQISYTYNNLNQVTSVRYPSGRLVEFKRYNDGSINTISLDGVSIGKDIIANTDIGTVGVTFTNGLNNDLKYTIARDFDKKVSSISLTDQNYLEIYGAVYDYYANGLHKSITTPSGVYSYTYYPDYQLKTESGPGFSYSYTYDRNGNRTARTGTSQASYSYYSAAPNKLAQWTVAGQNRPIGYDIETVTALQDSTVSGSQYDALGRRQFEGATGGTQTVQFFMDYNHENLRTLRMSVNAPTVSARQFMYDEEGHLLGEYSLYNTPATEYIWLDDKPLFAIYGSGASTKLYYVISDHLNTPRRLIDPSNNAVVWAWESDAFGIKKPTGTVTFNLRFAGQYADVQSGLFYNHNRYYHPDLGRYLEIDPVGLKGGSNTYIYALNNPISVLDADGKMPIPIILGIIGLAADITAITNAEPPSGVIGGAIIKGTANAAAKNTGLPNKADDLLKKGYEDVSHPDAAKAGHRTFENKKTGDKLRFDQGKSGQPGYEGQDHYHRYNPNATGKTDMYLDKNGNSCARGCDSSHLFPGD